MASRAIPCTLESLFLKRAGNTRIAIEPMATGISSISEAGIPFASLSTCGTANGLIVMLTPVVCKKNIENHGIIGYDRCRNTIGGD